MRLLQVTNYKTTWRWMKRKGISNLELAGACLFWLVIPGATAILTGYFTYRLNV